MKHGRRRRQGLGGEGEGAVGVAVREEAAKLERHCEGRGRRSGEEGHGVAGWLRGSS